MKTPTAQVHKEDHAKKKMDNFIRRFLVKKPRHSENIFSKKGILLSQHASKINPPIKR